VGRLAITNDDGGVRLWLAVSGQPDTDVMVFGQEPCSAGRYKRGNVCYLGLLPPPIGGRFEITQLYKARFGEPRPGMKVFIVTCQTKDGWKAADQETNARVPETPKDRQGPSEPENSQNPYMHKGGSRDAEGEGRRVDTPSQGGAKPGERGGIAAGADIGGDGEGKT
jgi:hypothetical protein